VIFSLPRRKEVVKKSTIGGIAAVHPSRQLLRSFLRMSNLLNAIKRFLILRRPQRGRLEGRTAVMQPISRPLFRRESDEHLRFGKALAQD
jgi:hypothetical protein